MLTLVRCLQTDIKLSSFDLQAQLLSIGALCSKAGTMTGMLPVASNVLLGKAQNMTAEQPGILQTRVGKK